MNKNMKEAMRFRIPRAIGFVVVFSCTHLQVDALLRTFGLSGEVLQVVTLFIVVVIMVCISSYTVVPTDYTDSRR